MVSPSSPTNGKAEFDIHPRPPPGPSEARELGANCPPKANSGITEVYGRDQRNQRPQQPEVLLENVPDHCGDSRLRRERASEVKMERSPTGCTSTSRIPEKSE